MGVVVHIHLEGSPPGSSASYFFHEFECRKWGLNGREDMRLCFTAFVSAKHWIGRLGKTPAFSGENFDGYFKTSKLSNFFF